MESILSDIRAEIESINPDQIRSKIESLVDALDVLRETEREPEYASRADVRSAAFKL